MSKLILAPGKPLNLWHGKVLPEWLDYNGHMTEHRYLQVFGESSDRLYKLIGVDFANAELGAYYTLETHIRHISECGVNVPLETETEILGYDSKRIHLLHRLNSGRRHAATGEHLAIHVARSKSCDACAGMIEVIASIFDAHRSLPLPGDIGSVLKRSLANSRCRSCG